MHYKTVEKRIEAAKLTTGSTNSRESRLASSGIKYLLKQLEQKNCKVYHSTGHFYCSGFIENNGRYVYYSLGDYRSFDYILIRQAKHLKDFTGGENHYTSLQNMVQNIENMLRGN